MIVEGKKQGVLTLPSSLETTGVTYALSYEFRPLLGKKDTKVDDPCKKSGSIIGCQNQSLGEAVSIVGPPFFLRYQSDRMPGSLDVQPSWTARAFGNGNATSIERDSAGRPAAIAGPYGQRTTLALDSDGNLNQITNPNGETVRLTYANGGLLSKTLAERTTQYRYDVIGNLLKNANGALVQSFLYQDRLKPIVELDGNNSVVSRFIYAGRSNVPDYMVKDGVAYRFITDQLGSPRLLVDTSSGQLAQRLDYGVFGNVIADTNPGFQPFGFAGGLYDRDTKLVRFGERDYDAETGRWTAKDPLLFAGDQANLYAYVGNDPVNRTDPSGTWSVGFNFYAGIGGGVTKLLKERPESKSSSPSSGNNVASTIESREHGQSDVGPGGAEALPLVDAAFPMFHIHTHARVARGGHCQRRQSQCFVRDPDRRPVGRGSALAIAEAAVIGQRGLGAGGEPPASSCRG